MLPGPAKTWWRGKAKDHHRNPTAWERRASRGEVSSPTSVIFLDVDGVICCNETNTLVGPQLEQLQRVSAATGAKIVLSTNWRRYMSFKRRLLRTLREASLGCVGTTPLLDENLPLRPREISLWLRRYSEGVRNWVVLDDRDLLAESGGDKLQGHFVHTHPLLGLTPAAADQAIEILGGGQPPAKRRRLNTQAEPPPLVSDSSGEAETAQAAETTQAARVLRRRAPRTPPFTAAAAFAAACINASDVPDGALPPPAQTHGSMLTRQRAAA